MTVDTQTWRAAQRRRRRALSGHKANLEASLKTDDQALRGYVDWRPQADHRALLDDVLEVFEEYEDHLPLSVRQVFYRLVGAHGYTKSEAFYNRLIYNIKRARRAELIPFDWVRDDGVVVMQGRWFGEVADFWDHTLQQAKLYKRDRQVGQPVYMENWTEATGMLAQLERVARDYSVPVYSASGGFAGLCAVRSIVEHALVPNVPTVILHVGDFDPSGEHIFQAITEDAAAFLREDRAIGTQRLIGERVALTADQVDDPELALSTDRLKPAKTGSAQATMNERWERKHGDRTCQLEALAPDVLAGIVREAIERHLDGDLLDEHEVAERAERVQLLRALPSGKGDQ